MDLVTLLPLFMFAVLMLFLLSGFPVAFVLSGTALLFAGIGHFFDVFYLADLGFVPMRVWGFMGNFTLVAVPLFVFMGLTLETSGIATELLESLSQVFRKQKASLAVATLIVGALLAASTGIVGATVVTMGLITLPTMLKNRYDPKFACGTIAAAGTLGQIIPPSIVLVILGDMMNVDVGDLFIGALIPGLLLVFLYFIYIKIRAYFEPQVAPQVEQVSLGGKNLYFLLLIRLLPPIALMFIVLGSILFGLASPTEAAACGACGALFLTLIKKRLSFKNLRGILEKTSKITAMVFMILIGAQFFGVVFRGLGGDDLIVEFARSMSLHEGYILFFVMGLMFLLGFYLDFLEICFIVIPIVMPLFNQLGFDPLWLGILIALNLQTSFLTPPFGFALFYLKGVAPPEIGTSTIYKGVIPFVCIQMITMILVVCFPSLVTWLPRSIF